MLCRLEGMLGFASSAQPTLYVPITGFFTARKILFSMGQAGM
jgi:hypothetical protein